MENCVSCYTCEKGVAKHVTAEMFKEAQERGKFPEEWYISDSAGPACINCYTCEKGFTPDGQKKGREMITYFLFLTNECNLRCDYCYATKVPLVMSDETLDQVKRFITRDEDLRLGDHDVDIHFFGGEPTLRWDQLQKFVTEFSRFYEGLYGRKIKWGMTTNATLLNKARLAFMKEYGITPLLSIDGRPNTHNLHRKTVSGGGSFDMIPLELILEYFPGTEIRPTITPETISTWIDDLEWFHSKGLYFVATEVAYEADWTDSALAEARRVYELLAEIYIKRRKAGLPVWMKFIDDGLNFLGVSEQTGHVCGVARGVVAIDALGNLFACQRYASFSDPSLAIGDVWKGFDEHKLPEVQSLKREDMYPVPNQDLNCDDCVARWRCRGGCNAMNYQCSGDRKMITVNHCKFHRMWAEISLITLARTGELWGKRYHTPRGCGDQPNRTATEG